MKTPTIYQIKYETRENNPYFFSPKTMKYFGQTLKDFKVRKSPRGNIHIYAKRPGGYTLRGFKYGDLYLVPILVPTNTEQEVLEYIANN